MPPSSSPSPTKHTGGPPGSPTRFITSTNAFGLAASPGSSTSSREHLSVETSPLSGIKPRLRRPSMLSLAQTASFGSQDSHEGDTEEAAGPSRRPANPFEAARMAPKWPAGMGFLGAARRQDSGGNLQLDGLTTSTPPLISPNQLEAGGEAELDIEDRSPPRWLPGHLQRRKGKTKDEGDASPNLHRPPFTGRPLHAPLLATLISETAPLEHEIRSEARLQRLISSHPRAVPFTPRTSRSSRGRFPETAGGDDDDDYFPSRRSIWASRPYTRGSSSDSDSDDMPIEDPPETVNAAFAAGMDMDRTGSESGWPAEGSGKSTPGQQQAGVTTPQGSGSGGWEKSRPPRMSFSNGFAPIMPSPGSGFALPTAFGGLGMGTGTPLGSPTIEKLEVGTTRSPANAQLATSPGAIAASPSMMQYRESTGGSASVRPGKRKAPIEDRFDPYKRPRGTSPSLINTGFQSSPSRPSAIPVPGMLPQSPLPLYTSLLGSSSTPGATLRQGPRNGHPYSRPMSSRSRAASPALSIGSTSGVLSSSLGNGNRASFSLAQAFVPTGPAGQGVREGQQQGVAQQQGGLGGLGLLSLAQREDVEMIREEGEMSREASKGREGEMDGMEQD